MVYGLSAMANLWRERPLSLAEFTAFSMQEMNDSRNRVIHANANIAVSN